jgi:diketogulonate reductase-like aldo/keto reductase
VRFSSSFNPSDIKKKIVVENFVKIIKFVSLQQNIVVVVIIMKPLFCSLLLLLSSSNTLPVVDAATNLYKGYSKDKDGKIDDIITTKLSNDVQLPMVGLGVGNLQRNLVESMIYEGLQKDKRIRLIDTAHQSGNEREVARGITTGVKAFKKSEGIDGRVQVHVITKIWYTYLGYERTKVAVDEILTDLQEAIKDSDVDLKVTLLLHWPRCYDHIPWMECEKEENNLPARVKDAGPPPHLDKDNAWKGSWKALEDVYNSADYPVVASIGVSNFDQNDMQTLLETSRTAPHITQINVWSLINDPPLIDLLNRSNINIQAYNVFNGILSNAAMTASAHHHILMVANQLEQQAKKDNKEIDRVYAAQVVLKWLVQFGISVIPRTSNLQRLAENSATALMNVPDMNQEQLEIVGKSINAMINNKDLEEDVKVKVRFYANTHNMFLYFVEEEDVEHQIAFINKGDYIEENTHPGHQFKVYNAQDPDQYKTYAIHGRYGDTQGKQTKGEKITGCL